MHGYTFDTWNWLMMSLAMTTWVVVVGAVVYVAVRLARRDDGQKSNP